MVKRISSIGELDKIKKEKEARTLYLENLYSNVTRERLNYFLNEKNEVDSIEMPLYHKNKNKGFCFIVLKEKASVVSYQEKLDGLEKKYFSCKGGFRAMSYKKYNQKKFEMDHMIKKLKNSSRNHKNLEDFYFCYVELKNVFDEFTIQDISIAFKQLDIDVYYCDYNNQNGVVVKLFDEEDFFILKKEVENGNKLLHFINDVSALNNNFLKNYIQFVENKRDKIKDKVARRKRISK